ncbi:MAG: phenylalanine--tRNA ligase subunit beta, partial [Paramuribaculum sp.]|nr:phenylalanine--tRNA ligase subunit beta [Paramuribaculum sp.]
VYITNFILHGLGQPMHAFDVSKFQGGRIVVTTCPDGTPFTTLDGTERTLSSADLMICSAERPMCIAGVFGGLDSGVTDATTDIFLESAWFNPTRVRKTARRHGLNTDASFRYERGTDPNATLWALKIAARLVKEIAGGQICGEPVDIYPAPVKAAVVNLSYSYLDNLIGKHIPAETVNAIASSLEMTVDAATDDAVTLSVPTYRVDVTRPCDVVEDILRIYGYNNVETGTTLHAALQLKSDTDADRQLQTLISEQLTAQGFNEILCNSLSAESYYTDLPDYPADRCVRLLNPLSADLSVMRQTLLFGGLESIERNLNRRSAGMMAYEFGNVYSRKPDVMPTADAPLAPYRQEAHLALWITGELSAANWLRPAVEASVFDMRAYVSAILSRLGITPSEIKLESSSRAIFTSGIDITTRSGKAVGHLGIVTPALTRKCGIKVPVLFAELSWDTLTSLARKKNVSFKPLPKTLPVRRDLALLIDSAVSMDRVEAVVRESERKLLRSVELFDVYEGDRLPQGKKSYAIAITLQDDEKTLVDKQIESVMSKITANLSKKLGAELR